MTLPAQSTAPSSPLESLSARLKGDLAAVNGIIMDRMQSDIPLIPELAGHLIAAGGKRIRPLLTLASAALFDCKNNRQHRLAAAVEFIHTATLLHDDVVDASDQRRGKASANALFGNEAAVLVGDFLFSRSFQLMVEDGSLDVLRVLSSASAVIAEGEVLQLSIAGSIEATEEQYFKVIRAKTAALFAAACEVGAIVAGRDAAECRAMHEYGMALGIGFQISDDVLDYAETSKRIGKNPGDDFREGKMTLPVIKAIAAATPAERDFWRRCMNRAEQQESDLGEARALLQKHGALKAALDTARAHAGQGRAALMSLPDSPLRRDMLDLALFAVERDH